MRIGLIDVDGKSNGKPFPNYALMKISTYHKTIGDSVEWYDQLKMEEENAIPYDVVYMSKIFNFTPDYPLNIKARKIVMGGTGYNIKSMLPEQIENCKPDYSIYPNCDYAIGFLTRGCINKCSFCVVPKKEGDIRPYLTWQEIKRPDSSKIVFMDNNVLACEYGIEQMRLMIGQDIKVDFNQGMDVMLMTDEIAEIISKLKWIGQIRFSCDKEYQMPYIEKAVQMLNKYGVKPYRIFVYVLGTTMKSTQYRVEFLRKLKVVPFVQPLRDINENKTPDKEICVYANYVNKKSIFKSCKWENYKQNKWSRQIQQAEYPLLEEL
jgi:hypothetical protein